VVKAMRTLMNTPTSFQQRYLCTGTNISFLNLFKLIAKEMKIKPPYLFAGTILSGFAWRFSSIIGWFTGKVTITKDSAKSAQSNVVYDSNKLIATLNFQFNSLEDTIQHAVEGRLDSKKFND
jgi:dihydroflavonol-4-reductase